MTLADQVFLFIIFDIWMKKGVEIAGFTSHRQYFRMAAVSNLRM